MGNREELGGKVSTYGSNCLCYSKQRVKEASRNKALYENGQIQNSETTPISCVLPYDQTDSFPNKNRIADGLGDMTINDQLLTVSVQYTVLT